jgi:hypothetical protein
MENGQGWEYKEISRVFEKSRGNRSLFLEGIDECESIILSFSGQYIALFWMIM